MNLSILYRGPLSSCNYACTYCPFAKHKETRAEHDADGLALERFLQWVEQRHDDTFSVFFTPWGEALIRKRYQEAFVRLSHLPQVEKVAIQTNLSSRFDWIDRCDKRHVGLWATFHPTEISLARFLARCHDLDRRGVRLSVGVVGLKEHADAIDELRRELPPHIYLWINAYKRVPDYYSEAEIAQFTSVDPLFPFNNQRHPSRGRACDTGESVISVDGEGTMRRCHFVRTPIGNIYEPGFEENLIARRCSNETCGCHIGYIHMPELGLREVFGGGLMERIPAQPIWLET